uniref:Bm8953 n=1 Tax=Brugia malayi TaxID=6279 RepID=A0A0H5S362_BRUMA|nr:Bm8953 [Brugia malayi]
MLMGFMVTLILLCIFLILSIYIYYKEKDEEFFLDNKGEPAKVKVDKAHSPYIITPEQKITQQLLSTEMVTSIGCSVDDIAQLLRYIALYGELSEDEIYQTPLTFIRLVVRGKTKFDKDDSKREQKPVPKSESKLGLYNDKEYLIKRYNTSARYIPQNFCNSLFQEKKTRGNELSNRLISDNKVKRSSRRGNAMVNN